MLGSLHTTFCILFSFLDEETDAQHLNGFDISHVSCSASTKFQIYQVSKLKFFLLFHAAETKRERVCWKYCFHDLETYFFHLEHIGEISTVDHKWTL